MKPLKFSQMKYVAFLVIAFSLSASTPIFSQQASQEQSSDKSAKDIGAPVPEFTFSDKESNVYTRDDLNKEKGVVVVLFNPTCDHCQDFAREVVKYQKELLPLADIIFVGAKDMKPYLEKFIDETGLNEVPEVKVGAERSDLIQDLFEYKSLPQINVYDKRHKMVWKKNGGSTAEEVLLYLK